MAGQRKIRDVLIGQMPASLDEALAPKESLTRLIAARDEVTKQSNNFLLAAFGFSLLYGIRNIGLRLDITILDYKIFETPYGLFVFCISSSICLCVSLSRFCDARIFDRYARAICENYWRSQADFAYNTYPRVNAWLDPTSQALALLRSSKKIGPIHSAVMYLTAILLGLLCLSPMFICGHFIWNFESLSNASGQQFQYWSVIFVGALDLIFLFSALSVLELDYE